MCWMDKIATFKSNINGSPINRFMNIENSSNLTTLSEYKWVHKCWIRVIEKGNSLFTPITKIDNEYETSKYYLNSFNELWKDEIHLKNVTNEVIDFISNLYKENSPEFIYYVTLCTIFLMNF